MSRPIVAITRPADRSKAACKIVEELGGQYILAPTLDLKPVNSESLKNLIANKDLLDWIVFTSPTTITSLNLFYPDFLKNLDCKVAVIGNKTGKIASEQGVKVDLIPEDFTAEGLLEEFEKRNITNQTIGIFPMDEDKISDLIAKIENNEIDAITFTSPLTVTNFFKISKNKVITMNIKEVLNSKVLDKNAYEVGTVTDFDIDQKEGTINSMIVSLKKGVFSKEELEVPFEDIETIGGYVILAKELPKPEEAEEEVEAQKVEVEKEE